MNNACVSVLMCGILAVASTQESPRVVELFVLLLWVSSDRHKIHHIRASIEPQAGFACYGSVLDGIPQVVPKNKA